jgi:carboxylesterase
MLVHSKNDTYVPPESMEKIYAELGSPDKQMMWVEGSGHVIPREPPRERVFQAATDFIRSVEKSV